MNGDQNKRLKVCMGNPSSKSYGTSLAIWDYSVTSPRPVPLDVWVKVTLYYMQFGFP